MQILGLPTTVPYSRRLRALGPDLSTYEELLPWTSLIAASAAREVHADGTASVKEEMSGAAPKQQVLVVSHARVADSVKQALVGVELVASAATMKLVSAWSTVLQIAAEAGGFGGGGAGGGRWAVSREARGDGRAAARAAAADRARPRPRERAGGRGHGRATRLTRRQGRQNRRGRQQQRGGAAAAAAAHAWARHGLGQLAGGEGRERGGVGATPRGVAVWPGGPSQWNV
jgi:hypothetical protein